MADSMLHIKDAYFFEVPKALVHHHWTSVNEMPPVLQNLAKEDPGLTVEQINTEMAGKVLIPQPFGTPKYLIPTNEDSGFCISKFMVLQLFTAIILIAVFVRLAHKIRNGSVVRGGFWNMCEAFLEFLRDGVARPAIGAHDADRYVPLLWTMFFFILGMNLFGMVPWAGSATGSLAVTLALAAVMLLTVLASGIMRFGVVGYWLNMVPPLDLPLPVRLPIQSGVLVIDVIGLGIRHFVLAIRLFANMLAGHLVLLSILGLSLMAAESATIAQWSFVTFLAVLGSAVLSLLELFVAFLQAYVFTFLAALFVGAAIHEH